MISVISSFDLMLRESLSVNCTSELEVIGQKTAPLYQATTDHHLGCISTDVLDKMLKDIINHR